MDGTNADNSPSDGVGCADRDAGEGGREQGDRTGAFGTKTPHWPQFGDSLTHGFNDTPASEIRPQCDRRVRRQNDGPMQASPIAEHV